jgi:hypothetical protein
MYEHAHTAKSWIWILVSCEFSSSVMIGLTLFFLASFLCPQLSMMVKAIKSKHCIVVVLSSHVYMHMVASYHP